MASWPSQWAVNFLSKPENAFMCLVDEQFILDGFNLFGLNEVVPGFPGALRIVLGVTRANRKSQKGPELLYGLAHARFVMTDSGIEKMLEKYNAGCFGHCPRVNCKRPAHCLPVGLYDEAGKSTVRLYCPQCTEVYCPPNMAVGSLVDGAYFGTSFPEMMFMNRPECRPLRPKIQHVTTICGFKIHSSAIGLQRYAATNKSITTASWSTTNDVDSGHRPAVTPIVANTTRQPASIIRRQPANLPHTTARRLTGKANATDVATVTRVRNANVTGRRSTNVAALRQSATKVTSVRKPNANLDK